jgi:deoxycytidylate deaminase
MLGVHQSFLFRQKCKDKETVIKELRECIEKEKEKEEGKMNKVTKDTNYLSWDNYFMGVALLSSMRSKDPNTKVGACIVNQSKRIIGIGYNGLPVGCSDDDIRGAAKAIFSIPSILMSCMPNRMRF